MTRDELTIAVAIDERYAPHFATCVASIAASRSGEAVRFFLLHGPTFPERTAQALQAFVRGLEMELTTILVGDDLVATLPQATPFYPQIVWYRLLIPELLSDLEKVLVLDADLLVLQSLAPLFATDVTDHLLAAAGQRPPDHVGRLGLDLRGRYLNTGVMVMNLTRMRDEDVGARAIALGHDRMADLIFPEQDTLNIVAAGRWRELHPRWNAMSHLWLAAGAEDATYPQLDRHVARSSPAIVHFEGGPTIKPWLYRCVHPYRFLYREFRETTPWPLESLEQASVRNALLRALPPRAQFALARAKARLRGYRSSRSLA